MIKISGKILLDTNTFNVCSTRRKCIILGINLFELQSAIVILLIPLTDANVFPSNFVYYFLEIETNQCLYSQSILLDLFLRFVLSALELKHYYLLLIIENINFMNVCTQLDLVLCEIKPK